MIVALLFAVLVGGLALTVAVIRRVRELERRPPRTNGV